MCMRVCALDALAGAHRDKWIIDPISCSSYKYWDLSLILALCVVVTITPYEVSLLNRALTE